MVFPSHCNALWNKSSSLRIYWVEPSVRRQSSREHSKQHCDQTCNSWIVMVVRQVIQPTQSGSLVEVCVLTVGVRCVCDSDTHTHTGVKYTHTHTQTETHTHRCRTPSINQAVSNTSGTSKLHILHYSAYTLRAGEEPFNNLPFFQCRCWDVFYAESNHRVTHKKRHS